MLRGLRYKDNHFLTMDGILDLIGVVMSGVVVLAAVVAVVAKPEEPNLWFALCLSGMLSVAAVLFVRSRARDRHRRNRERPGDTDS